MDNSIPGLIAWIAIGLEPRPDHPLMRIATARPIAPGGPDVAIEVPWEGRLVSLPPIPLSPEDQERWNGYTFDAVGIVVPGDPHPYPAWRMPHPKHGGEVIVQLWRQRARRGNDPVYAESLSIPHYPSRSGVIEISRATQDQLIAAYQGLDLLRRIGELRGGGRRRRSGAKWPSTAVFLDDLFTTLEARQSSTGKQWGHDPCAFAFRDAMNVYASDRTIRTYLTAAELTPDDVRSGNVSRSNYRQFISERGS